MPAHEQIDIDRVINKLCQMQIPACVLGSVNEIVQEAFSGLSNKRTVIVVMSNGGFDGIYELLLDYANNFFA